MAKLTKKPKLIYFIGGPVPNPEQLAEATELDKEYDVVFRNALFIGQTEMVEDFAELAGEIPDRYADAKAEKPAEADHSGEPDKKTAKSSAKSEWKPNA